jgi:hypothetical protein
MLDIVTNSEIKAMSAKFVKERFGYSNLKSAVNSGVDVKSHRISFEVGIAQILQKSGYEKTSKGYILKKAN